MHLKNKYFLIGLLSVALVIALDVFGYGKFAEVLELTLIPVFAIFYFFYTKLKSTFFSLSIGFYSFGSLLGLLDLDDVSSNMYYICNMFYMLGYLCLLIEIIKAINLKKMYKHFKLELSVLFMLFLYMIYVLEDIIKPITFETNYMLSVQVFELLYNVIVLLVLVTSFLNYIQNTSEKFLNLFLGCAALVFSELILIGYYYIDDDIKLSYLSTILYLSGFLLLFYQSQFARKIKTII